MHFICPQRPVFLLSLSTPFICLADYLLVSTAWGQEGASEAVTAGLILEWRDSVKASLRSCQESLPNPLTLPGLAKNARRRALLSIPLTKFIASQTACISYCRVFLWVFMLFFSLFPPTGCLLPNWDDLMLRGSRAVRAPSWAWRGTRDQGHQACLPPSTEPVAKGRKPG